MKKVKKGNIGYIRYEKVKRGLVAALMFAIPLIIFFTGLITTGTRKNLLTVVAILGVIPAARFTVSWIMIMLQKDADPEMTAATEQICPDMVKAYELTVTAYEGRMPLDCVVVYGGSIACYSSRGERNKFSFMEKHIESIMKSNGLSVKTKIFSEERGYLDRIRSMARAFEARHADDAADSSDDPKNAGVSAGTGDSYGAGAVSSTGASGTSDSSGTGASGDVGTGAASGTGDSYGTSDSGEAGTGASGTSDSSGTGASGDTGTAGKRTPSVRDQKILAVLEAISL